MIVSLKNIYSAKLITLWGSATAVSASKGEDLGTKPDDSIVSERARVPLNKMLF